MICKYLVGNPIAGNQMFLISICTATAAFSYSGVLHHLFKMPDKSKSYFCPNHLSRNARKRWGESVRQEESH